MRCGKKGKKTFMGYCTAVLLLCGILMMGCSSKDSIVGTWYLDEQDYTITFYDDGTCMSSKGDETINYKQQEDGTLIFTWGIFEHQRIIKRTDDKEQALDDKEYYYLSGNTFIFDKTIFER